MKTLFFLFATLFVCKCAQGTPLPAGWQAAATLAELSPAEIGASANAGLYWMGALLVFLQVASFFRPQPALHKQFADKEDTDKKLDEIKKVMEAMEKTFSDWSSDHYDARRRMHRKINHLGSALSYLAGTIESRDPKTAQRLKDILDAADQESDDE